jgi:hypothetical protein
MAKLPGIYEYLATMGAPAINLGRGILGYQDPFLTQTMQDRMAEIEGGRTRGNVGYDEYGLVPSAGRFTGGLMDLAMNRPADFALAGSIGKYDFDPEGRKGLEYNFTPDQDTGTTGNFILDFINRGGIKEAFSKMGTAQASDLGEIANLQSILNPITPEMGANLRYRSDPSVEGGRSLISTTYPNKTYPQNFAQRYGPDVDVNLDPEVNMGATGTVPTLKEGILSQVDSRFPLYDDFTVDEKGDDLEENAVTVDELGNLKQPSGFKDFLRTMLGFAIPGAGLFRGDRSALQGIKSLNQRLRNTDFGRSKNLMDYLDMKKYGGYQGRRDAAARNMAQARGLQKQIDQRQSAIQTNQDRGRGDRPGGANYSAPSKPSKASSYRDSSSFGKSFHG